MLYLYYDNVLAFSKESTSNLCAGRVLFQKDISQIMIRVSNNRLIKSFQIILKIDLGMKWMSIHFKILVFKSSCHCMCFKRKGANVELRCVVSRELWLETEGLISSSILTWEVKTSASSGHDATQSLCCITTLQGCYGWVVLIGLRVKETGMGVHKQDTVILHS